MDEVEYEHREQTKESQYGKTHLFSSVLPRPKVDPEQALARAIAKVSGYGQTGTLSSTDAGGGRRGDTETGNAGVSATEGTEQPVGGEADAPTGEQPEASAPENMRLDWTRSDIRPRATPERTQAAPPATQWFLALMAKDSNTPIFTQAKIVNLFLPKWKARNNAIIKRNAAPLVAENDYSFCKDVDYKLCENNWQLILCGFAFLNGKIKQIDFPPSFMLNLLNP